VLRGAGGQTRSTCRRGGLAGRDGRRGDATQALGGVGGAVRASVKFVLNCCQICAEMLSNLC
jgi:hypothetical protein